MERLTEHDEYGNTDIIGVDSANFQLNLEFEELNLVTDALNRLSAYEETGLAPREIGSTIAELNMMHGAYLKLTEKNERLQKECSDIYLNLVKTESDRDYWKAEALKHCAKLGEIKLLVGRSE